MDTRKVDDDSYVTFLFQVVAMCRLFAFRFLRSAFCVLLLLHSPPQC